jgi:hypothetical protein
MGARNFDWRTVMQDDRKSGNQDWRDVVWDDHSYNDRTVLKSGSFLNCFCPHCGASLMLKNKIHLETIAPDGQSGWIDLSPYLNSFEKSTNLRLPEGLEVKDLRCTACSASLKVAGRKCERGDSHVACVMVGLSVARVPFFFCMREGCHWHRIDPDDEHRIILDESMEW